MVSVYRPQLRNRRKNRRSRRHGMKRRQMCHFRIADAGLKPQRAVPNSTGVNSLFTTARTSVDPANAQASRHDQALQQFPKSLLQLLLECFFISVLPVLRKSVSHLMILKDKSARHHHQMSFGDHPKKRFQNYHHNGRVILV